MYVYYKVLCDIMINLSHMLKFMIILQVAKCLLIYNHWCLMSNYFLFTNFDISFDNAWEYNSINNTLVINLHDLIFQHNNDYEK